MADQYSITYNDYSNEKSSLSFPVPDIAAGGGNWDSVLAGAAAIATAIDAMTLCDNSREALNAVQSIGQDTPTNPAAQREFGVRVFYLDDTNGKKYHLTIPGPDLANLETNPGSDLLDLTGTLEAAFVTAFEAGAVSPDGNSVTVWKMVIVGRRS